MKKRGPMEAVIFDMDGVIVDSEPLHERAFREVFDEIGYGTRHGIHFPDYYGKSDLTLLHDFVARHRPGQSLEELAGWKEQRFSQLLREQQPIFDDLPELLERLSAVCRLGLASGSRHAVIREVLALPGLGRYFQVAVSSEDVPHGKPAPDVFLRAASLLEVEPTACWVIEDSAAGVSAGLAAGMTVIGITNSLPAEQLAHAHHVVSDYGAISRLLLG
jgi:HAD superfamily hydrolase (TIGR01509 family)